MVCVIGGCAPAIMNDSPYFQGELSALKKEILNILSDYPGTGVDYLDEDAKYIEIILDSFLSSGTDYGCAEASKLFYKLCSLDHGEFIVKVTNEWVPSAVNPMDIIWTKRLAGLGGGPIPVSELTTVEHQERVNKILRSRGIIVQ